MKGYCQNESYRNNLRVSGKKKQHKFQITLGVGGEWDQNENFPAFQPPKIFLHSYFVSNHTRLTTEKYRQNYVGSNVYRIKTNACVVFDKNTASVAQKHLHLTTHILLI